MLLVDVGGDTRAIRVVLVDLDNTLVDRDRALRSWLAHHGHDELSTWVGDTHLSLSTLAAELVARGRDRGRSPRELTREIRAELPEHLPPAEDARRALDAFAEHGLRIGLVTNGGGATQRSKLAAVGIDAASFDTVCISAERGVAKPGAEIFELALAELGADAREAVMIGDSPEHDVLGAHRAGLTSCWISRGRAFPTELARPDHSVPDIAAASRWLVSASARSDRHKKH